MDSHFKRFLDELQKMETHLGDRIEGRCRGLEHRVEEPVFDAEFTVDEGPVFDEEPIFDKGPLFDMEPVFDREPDDLTTTCIGVSLSDGLETVTTRVAPNATVCSSMTLLQASSTSNVAKEFFHVVPARAACASSTMNIEHSDINIDMPANCLTKCSTPLFIAAARVSSLKSASTTSPIGVVATVDIQSSMTIVPVPLAFDKMCQVVRAMKYVKLQPWPPPILLVILHDSTKTRPIPWPSFCYCQFVWIIEEGFMIKSLLVPQATIAAMHWEVHKCAIHNELFSIWNNGCELFDEHFHGFPLSTISTACHASSWSSFSCYEVEEHPKILQLIFMPSRNSSSIAVQKLVGPWKGIYSTQLPGGIIDLVHKLQCSVYSVPTIGTLLGCIATEYLKLVLAACANLLKVTKCWIVAPVQAQVTAFKSRTRLNSRADGIYIQSSRGVVVIFLCLIWLFEYNMILFKCFDHNTTMLLYLTWDPGGLVYDWCGLLHKLPLDQCFRFENSYKKASKMDWLNELLASDDELGFIIMDDSGTLYGTLSGNSREILYKFSVDLQKKLGRGRQSAVHFVRLCMERRHNYLRIAAELTTQFFINPTTNQPNIIELILAGSADFKDELDKSEMFLTALAAAALDGELDTITAPSNATAFQFLTREDENYFLGFLAKYPANLHWPQIILLTQQKCTSGAFKLAWHKSSFMVFWHWQLIQMDLNYIIRASVRRSFRSITLGGVVYELWLKWNSLGLECHLDIAFSVPGLRYAGNIANLSAKEVADYHGDKLHFSVGPMQASESSNLKVRCLIMVSQLLTTKECEMCCQITKRNMMGPWHPGDVLQAIVDLSERIHGQQGYVVTQFFQARLITKQLHWTNCTEEVFVRENITDDVVSMPLHQEHMHHIQEIYKEHQDQINSSMTGTCELQMEVPFHLKLVKTNQIYSSALWFDRWQAEWFFGDVYALGRGHLVYDQSSLLLSLPQNHDGNSICPGRNLRKQKNQA